MVATLESEPPSNSSRIQSNAGINGSHGYNMSTFSRYSLVAGYLWHIMTPQLVMKIESARSIPINFKSRNHGSYLFTIGQLMECPTCEKVNTLCTPILAAESESSSCSQDFNMKCVGISFSTGDIYAHIIGGYYLANIR